MAGRVRDVILKRTKEGLSRGMAIVEYEHPFEAVQAVSMFNEQQLFDRIMAVKIDLKDDAGQDDGRSMKLPSKHIAIHFPHSSQRGASNFLGGLKSIGAGLGIAGNPLRTASETSTIEEVCERAAHRTSRCQSNGTTDVTDEPVKLATDANHDEQCPR